MLQATRRRNRRLSRGQKCTTEVAATAIRHPKSMRTWPPCPTICQQVVAMKAVETYVVAEYVYDCERNYSFACRLCPRPDGVDDSSEKLRQPADEQSDGKEHSSTADVGDDCTVE